MGTSGTIGRPPDRAWMSRRIPANPTRILVCDATCQKFSMDTKGKVEIEVGCATIIAPPK